MKGIPRSQAACAVQREAPANKGTARLLLPTVIIRLGPPKEEAKKKRIRIERLSAAAG